MYFGLKLTKETTRQLLDVFYTFFDAMEGWTIHCDHITLIHESNPAWKAVAPILTNYIGRVVKFKVNGIGYNDNVIAFRVTVGTANKVSHITIATAPDHKPVESDNITKWEMLYCDEEFEGTTALLK